MLHIHLFLYFYLNYSHNHNLLCILLSSKILYCFGILHQHSMLILRLCSLPILDILHLHIYIHVGIHLLLLLHYISLALVHNQFVLFWIILNLHILFLLLLVQNYYINHILSHLLMQLPHILCVQLYLFDIDLFDCNLIEHHLHLMIDFHFHLHLRIFYLVLV